MPERVEAQVAGIEKSVGELAVATGELTRRQAAQIRRLRRATAITVIGLTLDLLLTVLGGLLMYRTSHNSARIDHLQQRTSTEALCPLYDLFLDSYNPTGPTAAADPAGYERNFDVIEQGARALGCTHTTRGRD